MRTTLFKYKLMRIRAKIGFEAFRKKQTILELMLNRIMESYGELLKLGELPMASGTFLERFLN